MRLLIVCGLALGSAGLAGCFGPGYEQAVEERYEELLVQWQKQNPEKSPTEAEVKSLLDKATAEVKAEMTAKYGEGATGAVSSILTGNWPAAAFHGLGLVGIFLGTRKRKPVAA